jgi:YggT family protein
MMYALGQLILLLLDVFLWIIILQVILSWLIMFEVVNIRNPRAANFIRLTDRITDPVFRPLRKVVPPIAGIDITPIIVVFAIYLLESLVRSIFFL